MSYKIDGVEFTHADTAVHQANVIIAALRQQVETLNLALDAKIDICGDQRITELRQKLDAAEKAKENLRDAIEDAAIEWARYVEIDTAHITLPNHMMAAFDAAIAAGRKS